jgi:hypothetical protein
MELSVKCKATQTLTWERENLARQSVS